MDFLNLSRVIAGQYFSVPDYQRDYEWTNKENSTLVDDVFNLVADNNSSAHFTGAIVTTPYNSADGTKSSIRIGDYQIPEKSVKYLLDGQQRLTSLMVFISVLKRIISEDQNIENNRRNVFERQLEGLLFGQDWNSCQQAPKLILNSDTGYYFNQEVLGLIPDEQANGRLKGPRRLKAAMKIYEDAISDAKRELIDDMHICQDLDQFYSRTVDAIRNKIIFVEIACDETANAFQVFDSLNGKGLDLTAPDRIKNIFMSWAPAGQGAQKWDSVANEIGEENLLGFFNCLMFYNQGRRVSRVCIPDEFKAFYRTEAKNQFPNFFDKMKKAAILYAKLKFANTGIVSLDEILLDVSCLNSDQAYNLLFAVAYHFQANQIIQDRSYKNFVLKLISLLVRMQVCGRSSNKYDVIFATAIREMKENRASIDDLTNIIGNYLATIQDDVFKPAFANFSSSDKNVSEFYVRNLENYYRKKMKKDGSEIKKAPNITVEHIIPQTLPDLATWYGEGVEIPEEIMVDFKDSIVERIANKALLYDGDNTAASNRSYSEKVDVYRNGRLNERNNANRGIPQNTFCLIEDLLNNFPNSFTHVELEQRANQLAEVAAEIWK